MTTNEPNHEALVELRKLIARLGGAPLPAPSGRTFCDDCRQGDVVYPFGRVDVCSRCWHRRDVCRQLMISEGSLEHEGQPLTPSS